MTLCIHLYVGAIAATGRFTEGTLPLHVIDINCTGAEQRVLDCPHNNLVGQHACDHRQDASVRCQGISKLKCDNIVYKERARFARSLLAPVSKHIAYFTHINLAYIYS